MNRPLIVPAISSAIVDPINEPLYTGDFSVVERYEDNGMGYWSCYRDPHCKSDYVAQVRRSVAGDTVDVYEFIPGKMIRFRLTPGGAIYSLSGEFYYVAKLYDQFGNGADYAEIQGASINQSPLMPDQVNGYPAMNGNGAYYLETTALTSSMVTGAFTQITRIRGAGNALKSFQGSYASGKRMYNAVNTNYRYLATLGTETPNTAADARDPNRWDDIISAYDGSDILELYINGDEYVGGEFPAPVGDQTANYPDKKYGLLNAPGIGGTNYDGVMFDAVLLGEKMEAKDIKKYVNGFKSDPHTPLLYNPVKFNSTYRFRANNGKALYSVRRVVAGDIVSIYEFKQGTNEYRIADGGAWVDGTGETFYVFVANDMGNTYGYLYQVTSASQPQLVLNAQNGWPSILYDGIDDSIGAQSADVAMGTDSYTFESWIKMNSWVTFACVQDLRGSGTNQGVQVRCSSTGIGIFFDWGAGSVERSSGALNTGELYHVVGVADRDGDLSLYVNATLIGGNDISAHSAVSLNTDRPYTVGCHYAWHEVDGYIPYHGLYKYPWTQADVTKNYQAGLEVYGE